MCFPVNFAKFLRTPILQNTSGKRPLDINLDITVIITAKWLY